MFPRVKLDRTTTNKKFVAANGEKIKYLGEKTLPFKSVEGVHRFKIIQEHKRCEALDLNEKGRASWQCRGTGWKNPHIRSNRDGTVFKLDVNNGVYTMDM